MLLFALNARAWVYPEHRDITLLESRGGPRAVLSAGGRWIYFSRGDDSLWKTPTDGGEETQVLPPRSLNMDFTFTVAASGIYYASPSDPTAHTVPVTLYRFADG